METHQESAFNTIKNKLSKRTTEIQNAKNLNCLIFLDEFIAISKELNFCFDFTRKKIMIFSNDKCLTMNMNDVGLVNIEKESNYDRFKSTYLERKIIESESLNDVLKEYKREVKKNKMSSIYK